MSRYQGTCTTCGHRFTDHEWIERHSVTDHDADRQHLDAGDYHEDCCPICSPLDEAPR